MQKPRCVECVYNLLWCSLNLKATSEYDKFLKLLFIISVILCNTCHVSRDEAEYQKDTRFKMPFFSEH